MNKESFYFRHDYHSRSDEKLLQLRSEFHAEGYGIYWMIVESMAEASDSAIHRVAIGGLSLGYGVAIEKLEAILNRCITLELFKEENGAIISTRMVQWKAYRKELSDAGKRGAKKRWSESQKNSHPNATPLAYKGKERKEKKINTYVVSKPVQDLFLKYEELSDKKLRMKDEKRMKKLQTLLETFSQEEIEHAWIVMSENEFLRGGNKQQTDFFTFDYATRREKIEQYLQQFTALFPIPHVQ